MRHLLKRFCVFIALVVVTAPNLFAGIFIVSGTSDSGAGSLRQAILNANAHGGGAITFFKVKGVITLQSALPELTNSVLMIGPGKNVLTVSGAGKYSIFSFGPGTLNLISGLTIANGFAAADFFTLVPASGINNSGKLIVEDCVVSNCLDFGSDGGAVLNSGQMEMNNCVIVNSGSINFDSEVYGGALFNSGGLAMQSCTISNCTAFRGGGIYNQGNAFLSECLIEDCGNDSAEGDGAGIYHDAGYLNVADCIVSNCSAGFGGGGLIAFANVQLQRTIFARNNALEGGGLDLRKGTNSIQNCTISSNEDFELGGAGIKNLCVSTFSDCTVSGNTSYGGGGGIENLGQLALTNCTVSGNSCSVSKGAGVLNTLKDQNGGTYSNVIFQLTDCTIVSNNATGPSSIGGIENDGGMIFLRATILADNSPADFSGGLNSEGYNLILNTNGVTVAGDTTGNIHGKDPRLGPLHNNGSFTFTHALLAGSPAIAAGPINSPPRFDQRGVFRPLGVPQDIGAYQTFNQHIHFLSLASNGNSYQVALYGTPGLNYLIQRATSPMGPWATLTNVVAGSDGTVTCLDTNPVSSGGFYRSILR